jgi:ribosomal protein S18 acetylase RimI-like enzyme
MRADTERSSGCDRAAARIADMEIHPFCADHLDGVLALCVAEGWPSLPEDPVRALRILTAPGVTTVVAVIEGEVVGFGELFSDGELQAFLTSLAVSVRYRGRGIGRALVEESLRVAGGERIDLLSEEASVGFYESFPHFRKPGFRLYPFHQATQD